jgi:hypothetical protein
MQPPDAIACPPGSPAWGRISEHHWVRPSIGFGPPLEDQVVLHVWQVVLQRKKPARGRL